MRDAKVATHEVRSGHCPRQLERAEVNAKLAEELGFDYARVPHSQSLWYEAYVSLSVAANATSRVRLGMTAIATIIELAATKYPEAGPF